MNNYRVQTATNGSMWRRLITSIAAAIIFIVVLGVGTVSYAFPETPATVTATSANIRAAADPSSAILASVKQGDVVSVFGEATGTDGIKWYHMHVDANTQGYIRSDLVSLGQGSLTANTTTTTTTPTTTTTNLPETQVTPVETKQATVETNNVRIRKGASTEYGIVATANRGMIVNVTGEAKAADGKTWYQVSFTYDSKQITGFIRSDLVTFEALPADTTQSQIGGTVAPEQQPEPETTVEPETTPEVQEPEPEEEEPVDTVVLMNTTKVPYVPGGFDETILGWQDQKINAYKNGAFYIFYANRNGEEGWYLYDSEYGTYMRYVYETATATIPEEKGGGMAPIIILAIVIVVLIAVIALMFLKLREYTGDYDYDEDDDDEDDNDDDDDDDSSSGSRQPQRAAQTNAPARRPVSNTGAPRPTSNNARPGVRNVERAATADAQKPQERTRENTQTRTTERTQVRRPSAQPRGTRAKSFLEVDNDMEFIEI